LITQRRFKQLDRFDHHDFLLRAADKDIDSLPNVWMDNRFESFQSFFICKHDLTQLAAVDLFIFVEQPFAECVQDGW
jgi:hypothetical protein